MSDQGLGEASGQEARPQPGTSGAATPWTPGPWAWIGQGPHNIYLATTHSGRRYVMGFRRMGLQGAQPVFQVNSRMVPAQELLQFEVGDRDVVGLNAAQADGSVYRYDIRGIAQADACLIAAAPEIAEAAVPLVAEIVHYSASAGEDDDECVPVQLGDLKSLKRALAKAISPSASIGGSWMEREQVAYRLRLIKGSIRSDLNKAERSRRPEADKELCRKVYGEDMAALDAAIIAILSAPSPSSDRGGS